MPDRREDILARLPVVIGAIPGIVRTLRNQKSVTGKTGATVVISDGDEASVMEDDSNVSNRRPIMIDMTPGISLLLGEPSPTIGTTANNLRAKIIYAVMTDEELQSIVGTNGFVKYQGLGNELDRGNSALADYSLNFRIRYPLFVNELS